MDIAPKDVINRANLALYGMYAGDFATAADEARAVLNQDATAYRSYLPLAMAAIAKGDFEAARGAYASTYARLLEGEIALRERRYVAASEALRGGLELADLWWSRLALGIAYVEAGHPAEALGELEQCRKRQGEATAIMLDDLPSIRYLAPLPYWLARAQEAVGQTASARANYSGFLRIRSADTPEAGPLVQDAQRRLEALSGPETQR